MRGARDLLPLIVPLFTLGLERAITLSEAMESRGFGIPQPNGTSFTAMKRAGVAVGLTSTALAGYLLAVGRPGEGALALATGVALFVVSLRGGETHRTVFRSTPLQWRDWAVVITSGLAAIAVPFQFAGA